MGNVPVLASSVGSICEATHVPRIKMTVTVVGVTAMKVKSDSYSCTDDSSAKTSSNQLVNFPAASRSPPASGRSVRLAVRVIRLSLASSGLCTWQVFETNVNVFQNIN